MKVLAFAASNSKYSINKRLVEYAAGTLESVDVRMIDLNDFEMPLYSIDRENEHGIPEQASKFRQLIGDADALIISFAEHNGSYTAAFKNLFDWTSRIDQKVYQDKPMILLATSPGKGGARNVLALAESAAPHFAGQVRASFSLPNFFKNFDSEVGAIKDSELDSSLRQALKKLVQA